METVNVLIAGGGIIGTSVAWALARRGVGGIVVVDLDHAGLYASSELNAGGARASWWQPVNIASCARTLEFFRSHAEEFGFNECGYLWLYDDPRLLERARGKLALQNEFGLEIESLTVAELEKRFPVLDRAMDEILGATHSPRDGLCNPNAVRRWYRREALGLGVHFLDRHYIAGVTTERAPGRSTGGASSTAADLRRVAAVDVSEVQAGDPTDDAGVLRDILTTHRVPTGRIAQELRLRCETVINCLGAWSPVFSAKIGISDVTEPVRRQIALVDVHEQDVAPGVELEQLGMIVDASGLYFHPEGGHILAGYSIPSEPPGFDFEYDGREFFEQQIWPRLAHRASSFERCGHVRGWAGLYAVTPDRSGIAGAVEGFSNLFEAHSFTGRGVMQSYGIATAVAELVDTGRTGELELAALSRERFRDPSRWVTEDLHI